MSLIVTATGSMQIAVICIYYYCCLLVCLLFVCCLFVCLFVCLFIVCLSVYLFVCLFVCCSFAFCHLLLLFVIVIVVVSVVVYCTFCFSYSDCCYCTHRLMQRARQAVHFRALLPPQSAKARMCQHMSNEHHSQTTKPLNHQTIFKSKLENNIRQYSKTTKIPSHNNQTTYLGSCC